MKYKGNCIKGPESRVIVFPREELVDGQIQRTDLVFILKAVLDYAEFEALCPQPEPPNMILAGGEKSKDFEDSAYKIAVNLWYEKRLNWMCLKSLSGPNPGDLEWEAVDASDPETWHRFKDELREAYLTPMQINFLVNEAMKINSIDEARMKEARESFLTLSRSRAPAAPSQKAVASNTQSGVPVSV